MSCLSNEVESVFYVRKVSVCQCRRASQSSYEILKRKEMREIFFHVMFARSHTVCFSTFLSIAKTEKMVMTWIKVEAYVQLTLSKIQRREVGREYRRKHVSLTTLCGVVERQTCSGKGPSTVKLSKLLLLLLHCVLYFLGLHGMRPVRNLLPLSHSVFRFGVQLCACFALEKK